MPASPNPTMLRQTSPGELLLLVHLPGAGFEFPIGELPHHRLQHPLLFSQKQVYHVGPLDSRIGDDDSPATLHILFITEDAPFALPILSSRRRGPIPASVVLVEAGTHRFLYPFPVGAVREPPAHR